MDKKLFKEHKLFKELHPDLNKEIDFSKIYDTSSIEVTWQCTKDIRHVWKQRIRARTKQGYGCSFCSKHRTLPEESLAALFPEIAAEIHPNKNPNFDAETHSPTSNKNVFWICSKGHEWNTRVEHRTRRKDTGCPICRKRKKSFAFKHPDLLKEWHPTANESLNPWELTPSSNKKVMWKCLKDSKHSNWIKTIQARTKDDKGCPECSKNINTNNGKARANSYPPLNIFSPELSNQWHPIKNKQSPSDFLAGSSFKAWWICPDCNHEWEAVIRNRAIQNKGCPICSNQKRGRRNQRRKGNLVQTHPELVKQWHPTLNKGKKPEDFTYGSAKKIMWQCLTNKEHTWLEKINLRTKKNSTECRICKKEANSLQTNYPEIAAEWHPTKNGSLTPNDVSKASGEIVWWLCHVNPEHEWKADVRNRTLNKSNCNKCSIEKTAIHHKNPDQVINPKDVEIFHIFSSNMESLSLLLEHPLEKDKRLIQPMLRMIYSSAITALESFLSDAFVNKVSRNDDRIVNIIQTNNELTERKYSIEEIVDWHQNVESNVMTFLSNIIWHKIYKVRSLYENTLNIQFPENTSDIVKAVGIRHDLVHRNGKTKSGRLHRLSKANVSELITEIKDFVTQIQKQLIKID